jgi:hypothetical protein
MNLNVPAVARGTPSDVTTNEKFIEELAVCSRRYLKNGLT